MRSAIRIGNLDYSVDARILGRLFMSYGPVYGAKVVTHHDTGESTGVGFVEMQIGDEGEAAIAALNGHEHFGRILSVCWNERVDSPGATSQMFGPMNMPDALVPSEETPEQRGLPKETARGNKLDTTGN